MPKGGKDTVFVPHPWIPVFWDSQGRRELGFFGMTPLSGEQVLDVRFDGRKGIRPRCVKIRLFSGREVWVRSYDLRPGPGYDAFREVFPHPLPEEGSWSWLSRQ